MDHVLTSIIHAFVHANQDALILQAKWDIKDGFWQLDYEDGHKWNFCYVLPQEVGKPTYLVVPTSLQMGWIKSPTYFCMALESGRDVVVNYVDTPWAHCHNTSSSGTQPAMGQKTIPQGSKQSIKGGTTPWGAC